MRPPNEKTVAIVRPPNERTVAILRTPNEDPESGPAEWKEP